MTFSIFAIFIIVLAGLVAFINMVHGFFSATISAILAVFAAVTALCYHETVVEKLLGGKMADSANAMMLVLLFAVIYFVLRAVFDSVVPGNIRLPLILDKAGGALMGIVAGIFTAGIVAVAAQEMNFYPAIWQYSRYPLSEVESVPVKLGGGRTDMEMPLYDPLAAATFSSDNVQKMLLPADDMLIGLASRLSDSGALSTGKPLETMHPDWLQELYGQRLGIEPGARRVLIAIPGKTREAYSDGVYVIARAVKMVDGELNSIRSGISRAYKPADLLTAPMAKVLVVVRVRFKDSAGEHGSEGGGLIRVSCGAVRLVTPVRDDSGNIIGGVNNFPIATLQHHDEQGKKLPSLLAINQNIDDPILLRRQNSGTGTGAGAEAADPADAGIDFVFALDRKSLGVAWNNIQASTQPVVTKLDTTDLKIPEGTFIEIKRLARDNLAGLAVLPESDLSKAADAVDPMRKDIVLADALTRLGIKRADANANSENTNTNNPTPAAPTAPEPPPTPVAPTETLGLELAEPPESPKVSANFYTQIGLSTDSGQVQVPGGTVTVDKGTDGKLKITALSIDSATARQLRGERGASTVTAYELATPDATSMVLVRASPKADAPDTTWAWRNVAHKIALVSDKGEKSSPLGVWVKFSTGEESKISARFQTEGTIDFTSIKPAGTLESVWFAFIVPNGTKISKLVLLPDTTVKDMTLDVQPAQ